MAKSNTNLQRPFNTKYSASEGEAMFALCEKLFPLCRSITGEGFRQSLDILNAELGGIMQMHSIKSGTKVFDWVVPPEWYCDEAYITSWLPF